LRHFLSFKVRGRVLLLAVLAGLIVYMLLDRVLIPYRVVGISMEPSYSDGEMVLCWRGAYMFAAPDRGDVVFIRFGGSKLMLLKRVAGKPGDVIAFRKGVLWRNGRPVKESYVELPSHWNAAPQEVFPGNIFVVGDNRSMDVGNHFFGQVAADLVAGGPLW